MSEGEARDLISVPPATETLFRAIATEDATLGRCLLDALAFRARVLTHFERQLQAAGHPISEQPPGDIAGTLKNGGNK